MLRMTRRAALLGTVGAALAACTKAKPAPASAKGGGETLRRAVKVPDNRVEHPQRGIDSADIVFVQLDGYRDSSGHSGTRLVPVFHSRFPDSVEPVRSIRPVDIALLSPMDALIGNTGAASWVINYVKHYRAHLEGMLSYWTRAMIRTCGWPRPGDVEGRTFPRMICKT